MKGFTGGKILDMPDYSQQELWDWARGGDRQLEGLAIRIVESNVIFSQKRYSAMSLG
jgi:hypothetical protein